MRKISQNLSLTAMFLSLGIILPMLTGQVPQIGSMLLPMHIPVFLCAYICGYKYSVPMSFILPLLRSILFSRPNMYPEAISIAFELAVYALVTGLIYSKFAKKNIIAVYISLILAMILGRIVRILLQMALLGLKGTPFTFSAVFSSVVIVGLPGIILQLVFVPLVLFIFKRNIKNGELKRN